MVNDIPISGLLSGEYLRTRLAESVFEQGGIMYKGFTRPNPPRQINVLNQAQLEAELGTDLEIPDNTALTIFIDESFTLTKPFKIGLGSTLDVITSTVRTTLTYTGPGALFQNTNPTNKILSVRIEKINLRGAGDGSPGGGTNTIFDLKGTSFLICTDVQMSDFGSIGVIEVPISRFIGFSPTNVNQGLVVKNPILFLAEGNIIIQFTDTIFTFFSFIMDTFPAEISIDKIIPLNLLVDSALFYVPPTVPTGTQVTINRTVESNGSVFQKGTDIAVDSVADNGSGKARFTTASSHGVAKGKVITLSGFSESTYNGTFIVTAVDVISSGVTFDIDEIAFVATDTGNMSAKSLDGTDIPVLAAANTGIPNSMFVGESGLAIFGSEVTSSSLAQNAFELITSVAWATNNLERFIDGVVNTGQLVCKDPNTKKYNISYSATLEKSSGGSVDIGIIILKNGVNVSFNPPHTVNTGKIQISGTDIIELTDADTLDIAVINYNVSAAVIEISQASLVVSRA